MSERNLETARENLVRALTVIDRLGEFFEAEHAWVFSTRQEWTQADWETKVEKVVDEHGFVLPELYEAQIHLAHALRDMLVTLDD